MQLYNIDSGDRDKRVVIVYCRCKPFNDEFSLKISSRYFLYATHPTIFIIPHGDLEPRLRSDYL